MKLKQFQQTRRSTRSVGNREPKALSRNVLTQLCANFLRRLLFSSPLFPQKKTPGTPSSRNAVTRLIAASFHRIPQINSNSNIIAQNLSPVKMRRSKYWKQKHREYSDWWKNNIGKTLVIHVFAKRWRLRNFSFVFASCFRHPLKSSKLFLRAFSSSRRFFSSTNFSALFTFFF